MNLGVILLTIPSSVRRLKVLARVERTNLFIGDFSRLPTYEYKCANGHVFELKQSFSDKPIDKCPECNASAKRVIHAASVTFKGSGWYVNDHGRTMRQETPEKSSSSSDASSTSSSSAKESKPAPAKESKDSKSSSSTSSSSTPSSK